TDHRDTERDAAEDCWNGIEHFAQVDDGHVRIARDERRLHPGTRGGIARAVHGGKVGMWGAVEGTRTERDPEAAGSIVPPGHLADARHARRNRPPQHVELHLIADVD